MPIVLAALVGATVVSGASLWGFNEVLKRRSQAFVKDLENTGNTIVDNIDEALDFQQARLGERIAVFGEGLGDLARKAFK